MYISLPKSKRTPVKMMLSLVQGFRESEDIRRDICGLRLSPASRRLQGPPYIAQAAHRAVIKHPGAIYLWNGLGSAAQHV